MFMYYKWIGKQIQFKMEALSKPKSKQIALERNHKNNIKINFILS